MVLLIALGAMGTAYGAWVDEIYVEGTLSTSDTNAGLTCGGCWEEVDGIEVDVPDTDIDCSGGSMTLTINVTNAQFNATPALNTHYYCTFIVSNAANSFPVEIKSVTLTPSGTYDGVSAVFDDLTYTVINPGNTASGNVHIHLTTDASMEEDLEYTLAVTVE
jgi:hypothetical protein